MNIGIDVDGVLTDIQGFNHKHAPTFFKKKFNRAFADESSYDIRDIFKCPENEYRAYWTKYLLKYIITEPPRKNAKKIVRQLRKDGHSIYIISKRVYTCRKDYKGMFMRFVMRNWLWRNGIRYKEIAFCDNDIHDSKRTACLERKIDVMIDDETVNINAIAPIARVICFDTSYNQDCISENVKRVKDFDEIYIFLKRENKKQRGY